jgi:hypothetical protein
MKKQILAAGSLLIVGMIAGCGGGNSPATSATTAISGKVADGYLVNATVFLDKNGNYQLDAGEPYAKTDANGGYTLNVDPADVGKYPIVVLAIKDVTIDKDTNLTVANSYILSMPKDSISGTVDSNFISPMSSQLRAMMETDKYDSVQKAMEDLRAKLGMPAGTNMSTDYIAGQNATMHTAAQNMATLMGGQMSQVFGANGSATTVDGNRYRGMMAAIFSDISSIKGSNSQAAMANLMGTMTTNLGNIKPGQPFHNFSAAFRGGMMGGGAVSGGGMMGSTTVGSMMGR